MNPEPKPDLHKRPRGIGWLWSWAIAVTATFFIILIICILFRSIPWNSFDIVFGSVIIATIGVGIAAFVRWVCRAQNLKRFLFGCACILTLIALFYAEEDWRGKRELDKVKREWEAKGEKFDGASVVPQTVPDDQNFAMSPVWIAGIKYSDLDGAKVWYGDRIYSAAVSNYFRLLPMSVSDVVGTNWGWYLPETPEAAGNWRTGRMTDLKSWQSFYRNLEETNPAADIAITPQPQTPARDVLLALSKYDPLIEQLRRDSELPDSRFPIDYDGGNMPVIALPHLGSVKPWARVLELRAVAELENGQPDKALEDINLILRLADTTRVEPFLISQLVRIAALQIGTQPIYEGLASRQWSDSQLAELDSGLEKFTFLDDYRSAMRGEMILMQAGFSEYLRRHPGQVYSLLSENSIETAPSLPPLLAKAIPAGWFYQNELHCISTMEAFELPVVDTNQNIVSPASAARAQAAIQTVDGHPNLYNVLERALLPDYTRASINVAYGQTAVNLARVAIGLERFRLAHGQYPDSLEGLSPQFINKLPHDIINGQPLHYQRTTDGQFVLYSVGWNETDDGGVVVPDKKSMFGWIASRVIGFGGIRRNRSVPNLWGLLTISVGSNLGS